VVATAAFASLRGHGLAPLRSARAGLFNIRHHYSRCSFVAPPAAATVDTSVRHDDVAA